MLVTSAACLKGPMINRRVRCGFDDLSDPNKQIRTIKNFKINPRFDRNVKDDDDVQFENNIAVIKLHTPLKFGPRCQSISYTTIKKVVMVLTTVKYQDGDTLMLMVKTEAENSQFADISVLSNAECNDLADPTVPKSQICAYDFENIKQAWNVSKIL
ncbi:unnamed protein product [Mytilus coruscus]|uniref:Peptidase S1 domain-containing protein n=1 Tax=Mytilus coruscus TaxID=42192 RepID=A0A6J8EY48_MYTCO|nr:unnamed protein product [Mytilus coruscus]